VGFFVIEKNFPQKKYPPYPPLKAGKGSFSGSLGRSEFSKRPIWIEDKFE
jgi:hypothetical protein